MTVYLLFDLVTSVPTPSPSPSPGTGGGSGSPTTTPPQWVPYLTLIAAVLAASVALFAAILQRKSGREAAAAARESAAAAKRSSEASERSAKASEDSVALNAETSRATAARLDSEALAKRFQDAASQLGHDQPAVRMAGAYSLARLADDWPDQRQTCVDVLCALLRMQQKMKTYVEEQHYPIDLPDDGDQQVRRTVVELISSRVNGADALWAACDFNLAYARLADFKLRDATISGKVILNGVIIEGECSFTRTTFGGGLDAQELRIVGRLKLTDVLPGPGRTVSLTGSHIDESGTLDFVLTKPPTSERQWNVWPTKIICRGTFAVKVTKTAYEQATFRIPGLQLEPTARFKVVQAPPAEAGSEKYPKIEAKEWATSASAKIEIAGALQRQGVFQPTQWTGVEHYPFKDAYVARLDIDAILADDDA